MENRFYRLADGRIWDTAKAEWINPAVVASEEAQGKIQPDQIIDLVTAEGVSNVPYLVQTLEFYGYDPGELAQFSPLALKRNLKKLDDIYLTPRTLAGLATGDAYALAQWREHEEKATPIRQRLAELENAAS